jgi:hypothetical protein
MFSYFTELNRRRVPAGLLDFVQHATSAIVHAADDRSVMETLESLPHVVRSVRALFGEVPYHLGPANIGMGFNPYGASTAANPDRRRLAMAREEPRADGLFAAAWAAGYLARAAAGGVDSVTLMAPGGPFGVATREGPRPAFHVVRAFAAASGAPVLACASSDPQRVLACACDARGGRFAWLVNLTAGTQEVALAGLEPVRLVRLDGRVPEERPVARTVELPPYAVAFVEA